MKIVGMCGRFNLTAKLNAILEQFAVEAAGIAEWEPRYNIAPTQNVLAVRQTVRRELVLLRWGLVPSWADDLKIGNSLINARAETVVTKPAFRSAFKRGRCLIVASGFYEWKRDGKAKQPFHFHMADGRPFAFAGLAERWTKGEKPVDSCTIITTDANELLAGVHDRMPVILPSDAYAAWLDPEFQSVEHLQSLLRPYPADEMKAQAVSMIINSPRNEGPECMLPVNST